MLVTILCQNYSELVANDVVSPPNPTPDLRLAAVKHAINPLSVVDEMSSYLTGRIIKHIYLNMTLFVVRRRNIKLPPYPHHFQREELPLNLLHCSTISPISSNAFTTGRAVDNRPSTPQTTSTAFYHPLMYYNIIIPSPISLRPRCLNTTVFYHHHPLYITESSSKHVVYKPHLDVTMKLFL